VPHSWQSDKSPASGAVSETLKPASQDALAIHIEVHNRQGQGVDRYELARVAMERGLLDEAEQLARQALALQREAQDPIEKGDCLRVLGEIAKARGHFDEARDCFARGLELVRAVPYPRGEGNLLVALGRLEQAQGDVDAARQALRDGTAILRGLGDRVGYVPGALALGELLIANDHNRDKGCALIAEAIAICHELGLPAESAARDLALKLGCDTAVPARS
jgi:tetratricopeptide (TPR) repeat protein